MKKPNPKQNKPQKSCPKAHLFLDQPRLLPVSAIPPLKPLAQTCMCSILCTCCKFHFARWAKLSPMCMKLKSCLCSSGFQTPPVSQHNSLQLTAPLAFRLFICLFSMTLGAAYLQEQTHLWEIHPSELPRSAPT